MLQVLRYMRVPSRKVVFLYGPPEAMRPGPRERPEAVSISSAVVLYITQLQTLCVRVCICTVCAHTNKHMDQKNLVFQ